MSIVTERDLVGLVL